MGRMFDRSMLLLAWCSAWLFALAGLMLGYEVAARYFFVAPTIWALELSQLALIYGSLMAMPWALKERKHIQIHAVLDRLNARLQRVISILVLLVLLGFSLYVTFYGWAIFADSFQRGRTTGSLLNLPSWIAELPVPVCFALLACQTVLEVGRLARGNLPPPPASSH